MIALARRFLLGLLVGAYGCGRPLLLIGPGIPRHRLAAVVIVGRAPRVSVASPSGFSGVDAQGAEALQGDIDLGCFGGPRDVTAGQFLEAAQAIAHGVAVQVEPIRGG